MPGLLDLPPELHLKIFSYLPRESCPQDHRLSKIHPAVSLVNRQLRLESLDSFSSSYTWRFRIFTFSGGNKAYVDKLTIGYLQALQQANQLWRLQRLCFLYEVSPNSLTDFSRPELLLCDVLRDILRQVPKLRMMELQLCDVYSGVQLCSLMCLQLFAPLPKTWAYMLTPAESAPPLPLPPRLSRFAELLKEATGKTLFWEGSAI